MHCTNLRTYGGPEARGAIYLVIFQSCIIFAKLDFFQFCIFAKLYFFNLAL